MLRFLRLSSPYLSFSRTFKGINRSYSSLRDVQYNRNNRICIFKPFTNLRFCSKQNVAGVEDPSGQQTTNQNNVGDIKFRRIQQILLFVACALTFITLILGGQTRRMKAGLSMTSWHFFHESFPATDKEWELEFAEYKKIPEYTLSDQTMTLEEYKQIYILEYVHRQLGRFTGAMVLTASVVLGLGKGRGDITRAAVFSVLVLIQGLLGWYMVKSGFDPSTMNSTAYPTVSPYRLTAHNFLGTLLFSLLLHRFYAGLQGLKMAQLISTKYLKISGILCHNSLLLCMLTVLYGGLMSGTHAIYADPSLASNAQNSESSPLWNLQPKWRNLFENQVLIQMIHKGFAYGTAGLVVATAVRTLASLYKPASRVGIISAMCMGFVLYQIHLGVTALNSQEMSVRMSHQITGIELVGILILLAVELSRLKKGQYILSNIKQARVTSLEPPPITNTKISK